MKKIKYFVLILITLFSMSLLSCKEKHTHQFKYGICECGKIQDNTNKIEFDSAGGTIFNPIYIRSYEPLPKEFIPTKEGHTFIGWETNGRLWDFDKSVVRKSVTLTAKWQVNQYTITFDTKGGTPIESITQDYGTEIIIENPTKENCEFKGWNQELPKTMPAQDLHLIANWQGEIHTITFNTDGGIEIPSMNIECGEEISIPDPYKEGYGFIGWDIEIPKIMPNNDLVLTALWIDMASNFEIQDTEIIKYTGNLKEVTIPYYYNLNDSKMYIDTIGTEAFKDSTTLSKINISDNIKEIKDYAFENCGKLTTINISENVIKIGKGVFANCKALHRITVDENNQYYQSLEGNLYSKDLSILVQYAVGKGNTTFELNEKTIIIYDAAFAGCRVLKTVTLNENITIIPNRAFESCISLRSVININGLEEIGNNAFKDSNVLSTIELPETMIRIGDSAFENCINLETINLANSITYIGSAAFKNTKITGFKIPLGLTTIEEETFYATYVTQIMIPSTVKVIKAKAFYECPLLMDIQLKKGLEEIGESAFEGCSDLQRVQQLDVNYTKIGKSAFRRCVDLQSFTIPGTVKIIPSYLFEYCRLTELIINEGVEKLDDYALMDISRLEELILPSTIKYLGSYILKDTRYLRTLFIPKSVQTIKPNAFKEMNNVSVFDLYCEASSKPEGWEEGWSNGIKEYRIFYGYTKEQYENEKGSL